jgi:hypothetical protein
MKLIGASILTALVTLLLAGEAAAQTTLRLNANQRLDKGQKIEVAGKGYLIMQTDGNFVLYDAAKQPKWATGTSGRNVHVIMQPDGNLVVYNKKTPLWQSDTWNANAGGGYFEIDLTTWTGRIYRADGTVAKVLFGKGPDVATAPVAQPTPGQPQTVQIVEGPTTVIAGTPAPATSYSNLQTTPTLTAAPIQVATAPVAQPTPTPQQPGQPVQLNIGTAPLVQPTPTPQTVQMIEGTTTVFRAAPTPATSYSNLQTTPAPTAPATQLQSGTAPSRIQAGVKCIDFALTGSCGYDRADKLGSYALNLKCSDGFYDPIWGGTCWKCPDDDGSGAFIRSANNIQNSDACWRVPKEKTGPATRVKNTSWAWECDSGTFWDGYDWGACWKCPDALPRRTAYPVYSGNACATPVNETKPAIFVKFNGCPDPQQALASGAVTPDGKRVPGRPFLDIGAGWAQGQAAGLCYACPVVDRDGNFLITDRSTSAVTASDACAVRMKYTAAPFSEPGMAGLGTLALIQEKQLLDPVGFTRELYRQAAANEIQEPTAWVGQQWADVAARPSENTYLRVAVFNRLLEAAQTPPTSRSPAQQAAVAAMEKYIHDKRVYVAQVALDMYKAWKARSDEWNATHAQSPVAQLFDYGTVPLDFTGMAAAVLAPAAATSSMLVAGSLSAQYSAAVQAGRAATGAADAAPELASVANPLQVASEARAVTEATRRLATEAQAASKAKAVVDATKAALSARIVATLAVGAIEIATTIIATVAMDQFISIITAQSRLEGALTTAKSQQISLATLISTPAGMDELRWHFAQAVGNAPVLPEPPALLTLAQAGNSKAAVTGYALPK